MNKVFDSALARIGFKYKDEEHKFNSDNPNDWIHSS